MNKLRHRLPYIDLRPSVLVGMFLRPVALSPMFRRHASPVDCFAQSGKGQTKKKEPNPIYSECYFSIGPDSDLVPA